MACGRCSDMKRKISDSESVIGEYQRAFSRADDKERQYFQREISKRETEISNWRREIRSCCG